MPEAKAFITLDFQSTLPDTAPLPDDKFDRRLCVFARNPTFTVASYLGYMQLAKQFAMRQQNSDSDHMLRLGFIPVCMPPSFWGDEAHKMILPKVKEHLHVYARPAASFLNSYYTSDYHDFWVSKLDVSEKFGIPIEAVRVAEVFKLCGV